MAKPGHIYHWKHGWIPITPRAAMVKAKGRRGTADRYMHRYGIEDHRQEGRDRRQGGHVDIGEKRSHEHRGTFKYVPGTKTRDYPDRNPHGSHGGVSGGPQTPGEAFGMKRHELEPHAKAGNRHAQDELDRRAAKRAGGAPAPKAAPKAAPAPEAPKAPPAAREIPRKADGSPDFTPSPEIEAENRQIEKVLGKGQTISSMATSFGDLHSHRGPDGRNLGSVARPTDPTHPLAGKFLATGVDGRSLGTHSTRLDAHKAIAKAAGYEDAPELPAHEGTPAQAAARVAQVAREHGHSSDAHRAALSGEDAALTKALNDSPTHGHLGHYVRTTPSFGTRTVSRHEALVEGGTYERRQTIGKVHGMTSSVDGETQAFTATHQWYAGARGNLVKTKELGTFSTRQEAHEAIARAENARRGAEVVKKAKAAEAAAKKSAKVAGAQIPGPNGTTWEPHQLPDDGTFASRVAREKAKQTFKAGNKTVVIETALSEKETKGLLADITASMDKIGGNLSDHEVKFLVPSGDKHFRSSGRGIVGAYVHVGGTVVHINPGIANGKHASAFEAGGHSGHFMPAAKGVPAREYTITHELGHVMDNVNSHTRGPDAGMWSPTPGDVAAMHKEHAPSGSKYARTNPAEGYAEAFAQWSLGGKGTHPMADKYAEHFGWKEPNLAPTMRVGGTSANVSDDAALRRALDPEGRYGPGTGGPDRSMVTDGTGRRVPAPQLDPPRRPRTDAEKAKALAELRRFREGTGRMGGAAPGQPRPTTVKAAKAAVATLPPDVYARVMRGRSIDSMSADELRAVLRAVADYAKKKG